MWFVTVAGVLLGTLTLCDPTVRHSKLLRCSNDCIGHSCSTHRVRSEVIVQWLQCIWKPRKSAGSIKLCWHVMNRRHGHTDNSWQIDFLESKTSAEIKQLTQDCDYSNFNNLLFNCDSYSESDKMWQVWLWLKMTWINNNLHYSRLCDKHKQLTAPCPRWSSVLSVPVLPGNYFKPCPILPDSLLSLLFRLNFYTSHIAASHLWPALGYAWYYCTSLSHCFYITQILQSSLNNTFFLTNTLPTSWLPTRH